CRSPPPPSPTPFPYTTLFRSGIRANRRLPELVRGALRRSLYRRTQLRDPDRLVPIAQLHLHPHLRDTLLHAVGRARETEPGSVGAREIRYCAHPARSRFRLHGHRREHRLAGRAGDAVSARAHLPAAHVRRAVPEPRRIELRDEARTGALCLAD